MCSNNKAFSIESDRQMAPQISRAPGLLLLSLLIVALPARADTPATIVTWHDWGPYVGASLPGKGIAGLIVREAFAGTGRDVSIRFRPWNRAYKEASEGMHLAAFPYAHNERRARDFRFTDALFSTSVRLFAARSHVDQDKWVESIDHPSICLPQGYNTRIAERLFGPVRIVIKRPRAMVNCMHMLRFARVDLVLVSERVGEFIINHEPGLTKDDFLILSHRFETPVHIMVSRALPNSQSLVKELNEQIGRMKANGRIESVLERYDSTGRQ
mgnify:CR=1 FL=1